MKKHLVKGSIEAKKYMAKLRAKRTVGAVKKKAVKKAAPKKKTVKKAAPKKSSLHKDTKSHNVNIRVVSGYEGTARKGQNTTVFYKNSKAKVSGYKMTPEIIVGKVGRINDLKDLIPAVKLRVTRGKLVESTIVNSGSKAVAVFKKFIGRDKIQTQEFFAVMNLKQNSQAVGVYLHSMGGITSVTVDVRLILAGALNMGAVAMIICHNHPSGNLHPSNADEVMTKELKTAAAKMNIKLMDHVIITKDSYYSFAENNNVL